MALLVWLPLNGDLRNLGLADIKMTSMGTTTYVDGKIGKCILFNNTTASGAYDANNCEELKLTDNFSFCLWLNNLFDSSDSGAAHYAFTVSRADGTTWGYGISCSSTSISVKFGSQSWSISVSLNTWNHIAFTKLGSVINLYLNGLLNSTKTFTGTLPTYTNYNGLGLGYFRYSGGNIYASRSLINDLRIYDHALSPKEVHEIAKGLVLHYPLNNYVGKNLLNNCQNITTGWGYYDAVSSLTYENGMVKAVGSSSGLPRIYNHTILPYATTLEYYTIYVDYVCSANIGIGGKSSNSTTALNEQGSLSIGTVTKLYQINLEDNHKIAVFSWLRPAATDTIKASWWMIAFAVNTTLYINSVKIEKGLNRLIVWSPYNVESSVVNDCSGYGNNGTLNAAITVSDDTSRYSQSCYFGSYNTPKVTLNETSILPALSNCTITWWGKYDSTKTLLLTGQSTSYYIGASDNNNFYHSNAGSSLVMYRNGIQGTYKCRANTWDFFVLKGVNLSTWTALKLNSYGSGWPLKGLISDFRIYSTALSDSDILELYNTSAMVYNDGSVSSYEFVEENTDASILLNGTFKLNYFAENYDYLYLPAGTYVNPDLNYEANTQCTAETIIRYEGGSGRDLMGYSAAGSGYWGVKADGTWEGHGTFSTSDSNIATKTFVSYSFKSSTEHGYYQIGRLATSFSVRNKYIYNVKLYKDNVLMRDLYPCKAETCGLYDILNGVFYPASSSSATVGNDDPTKVAQMNKLCLECNQLIEI